MWGSAAITFVNTTVVGTDGRLSESVTVTGHRVARVGGAPERGEVAIDLDGAFVYPGLVNAHDHLELNSFPRLKWRDQHVNVREWIADFQPRFAADPRSGRRAAGHARVARVGRRAEEPALRRDHRLSSQPAAPAAVAPLPGARGPALRLQPFAADRRRPRRIGISRDAAGVAVDHPCRGRHRRRGARRGAARSGAWAVLVRTAFSFTAWPSTKSARPRCSNAAAAWCGVRRRITFCSAERRDVAPVQPCRAAGDRQRFAAEWRRRPARRTACGTRHAADLGGVALSRRDLQCGANAPPAATPARCTPAHVPI